MLTFFHIVSKVFNYRCIFCSVIGLGFISCTATDDPIEISNQINSIEIISIDQAPNSKLDNASILSADLKYTIDPKEKSDYGFKIMIQFTKPGDTTSYSFEPNSTNLSAYSGTVKLSHALLKEWNFADTRHPIQCHYSLLNGTSLTTMRVLAKTSNIDYSE